MSVLDLLAFIGLMVVSLLPLFFFKPLQREKTVTTYGRDGQTNEPE